MSNPVFIDEVTKPSANLNGYHIYDDNDSVTAFVWENELPEDDKEWLYQILTDPNAYRDGLLEFFEFADEVDKGMTIRDTYYDWDELKETYNRALEFNKSQ